MQRSIRDTRFPTCPWVFFNDRGQRIGRFQRSWRTACTLAGVAKDGGEPDRLFHDLRRSGVRNLIRAGVPESVAMRISGHKTRSVFERYNIVSERDLNEAARKPETYVSGKSNPTQSGHTLGTPEVKRLDLAVIQPAKLLNLSGWEAGIRTPIRRSRVCSLTVRRPPNEIFILSKAPDRIHSHSP